MVGHSFAVGDTVIDREDPSAILSVVVSLPEKTATEWLMYGGTTVAGANPTYPADAPIVVVVATADVERYLPEWDGETSLSRPTLDEAGVYYTAVPAPRLITADKQSDKDVDALTTV